ncbi:hypothetical protein [Nocardiopsis alba]|uniref:hypothetical protein n=1 Tax=Nocardiopsis alba TaxID=53437 RepID=UPI0033BA69DD
MSEYVASRTLRELRWTGSVLLGGGKRLFAEGTVPRHLALASTRATPSGVLITTYHRATDDAEVS